MLSGRQVTDSYSQKRDSVDDASLSTLKDGYRSCTMESMEHRASVQHYLS